jgi:hypothetical protein
MNIMKRVIQKRLSMTLFAGLCGVTIAFTAAAAPATHTAKRAATATTRPASAALPSEDDIRTAFEAGEYQKVVHLTSRALSVKPNASGNAAAATAATYDRYGLLTIRGEAYLHLKQIKSAGDSFGLAAKETADEQKAATARAMQRTIREARGTTVQRRAKAAPAPGTPTTADLLKSDEREAAFRIVYDNLRESVTPKVKAATDARTLPPIVDALTALGDLEDLAQAGAGGNSDLAQSRQDLGDRGRDLIRRELDRMEKDVAEIKRSAETVVEQRSVAFQSQTGATPGYDSYLSIRRGLTDKDRTDLKELMKTCERIIPAAEQLARSVSGASKKADELVNRAKDIGRGAQRVLEAKYEGQQQKSNRR